MQNKEIKNISEEKIFKLEHREPLRHRIRLLIVDDDPDIVTLLRNIITLCEVEFEKVDTASTEEEARAKIDSNSGYDIALLDINGVNGIQVAAYSSEKNPDCYNVAITAQEKANVFRNSRDFHSYIGKPFDVCEVINQVETRAHICIEKPAQSEIDSNIQRST